jgi:hypothetical protein
MSRYAVIRCSDPSYIHDVGDLVERAADRITLRFPKRIHYVGSRQVKAERQFHISEVEKVNE